MANVLVAGCCGMVGAAVVEQLLAEGHRVTGVDSLNDAYGVRLKNHRLERLRGNGRFTFHKVDICERSAIREVFSVGFDAVVNLAARAGVRQSLQDPWGYYETNVNGTINLLDLCRESTVGKFVLASSSSVYGSDTPRPFREDRDTSHPLSPYASSKKAAETVVYTYHHLYGIDATVLRFFTVYGPAGRPDMAIFKFIRAITEEKPIKVFGDGTEERDFTHVRDTARGTVAALTPLGYETINLGSDQPVVLAKLISMVETHVGKEAKIEYAPRHSADVVATWADIGQAKLLLDWQPQVSLEEGIRGAVEWYQENREWAKNIGA